MNDKQLDAWAGLAKCHAAKERYQTAVEIERKAEEILAANVGSSSEHPKLWGEHYQREIDLYVRLEQYSLALESSQKYFRLNRDSISTAQMIIWFLSEDPERQHEIIIFLKELQADVVPKTGLSRLVQFPDGSYILDDSDTYSVAVQVARKTGDLDLIRETLLASIKSAKASNDVGYLLCHLALLTRQEYRDEPTAVRIWEHVIELNHRSPITSGSSSATLMASRNLEVVYYDRALEAERDSLRRKSGIKMLENIAKGLPTSAKIVEEDTPFALTTHHTTLVLGQLYQMIGAKSKARECFEIHVRLAVDLLTDDTAENDSQGYWILFSVFIRVKDDENAFAAISLLWPKMLFSIHETTEGNGDGIPEFDVDISGNNYEDGHKSAHINTDTGEASSAIRTHDQSGLSYSCDECNRDFTKLSGLYTCRVCYNVDFCGDCIKLVKEGTTKILQCNPKHEFLLMPSLLNQPPEGYVRHKDKDIPITTWIEQIKKEWEI